MTRLAVLRAVALKGRAPLPLIAESTGLTEDEVGALIEAALAEELVRETPSGLRTTDTGRAQLVDLLAEERSAVDRARMRDLYTAFDSINASAKSTFTSWQLRDDNQEPNDHADAAYDAGVLARLDAVHELVLPVLQDVCVLVPRAQRYVERLVRARERYRSGETKFVTGPIIDSYHTVWFEMHEDLISWAGLIRADEAAAGRAT